MQIDTVLWDWNGTLLDDVDAAVSGMNDLLSRYGKPLTSRQEYREMIDIPVINYYRKLFDFEQTPFAELASGFMEGYDRYIRSADLMRGARETLKFLHESGVRQIIVSSFHEDTLHGYLRRFGIEDYFEAVSGAGNYISEGKIERARALFEKLGICPERTLSVGDMVHDYELSQELGTQCILIPNGQRSEEKLRMTGAQIEKDLNAIFLLVRGRGKSILTNSKEFAQ